MYLWCVTMLFMRKGQAHPSTAQYHDFIANALIQLLGSKALSEITIKELCDTAQVSRKTYYRHFKDKKEVIDYYISGIMRDLAHTLKQLDPSDSSRFVTVFFSFLAPYAPLLNLFNANGLGDLLFINYIKYVTGISSQKAPQTECFQAFLLGGLWSLLTYWLSHGCVQSPEELGNIVCLRDQRSMG